MTEETKIQKELERLDKYNDPVLIMMLFLTVPGIIMATIISTLGDGTIIKVTIAIIFIVFTGLAFLVSTLLKKRIEYLKSLINSN